MNLRLTALALVLTVFFLGCARKEAGDADEAADDSGGAKPRFGALMQEVGRRFETMGRAVAAHRWELAGYQCEELEEVFEELPRAQIPERAEASALAQYENEFTSTRLPGLKKALAARDSVFFADAFREASKTCNTCHASADRPFIEVPSEPGAGVPRLDRIP
jgi:hypothetical protein